MKISRKLKVTRYLILLIAISSISGYLGILFDNINYKTISVITQFLALIICIRVIFIYRNLINWKKGLPILFVLTLYPLYRIFYSAILVSQFKAFTDAVIIYGYYQLVFVGLAISVLTKDVNGFEVIKYYTYFALPIGAILLFLTFSFNIYSPVGLGQIAITDCFVPAALLTFDPSKKINVILGWIALFAILYISAGISSRSYIIVGFLIALFSLKSNLELKRKKIVLIILLMLFISYFIGLFSFLNQNSLVQEKSTVEKFQFEELGNSIYHFINTGDYNYILNWTGNSRTDLLYDAFGNFSFNDWILGRGIFGTYRSFVVRSTIEVGWAQDTFRFGLLYVISAIIIVILGYIYLRKKTSSSFYKVLSAVVIIRLIDGFIYGVPQTSVYNLIFFWGVMNLVIFEKILNKQK